jgi:hypothetical protein
MEREKGFEPGVITGFSRLHESPDLHSQSSSERSDASGHVATERDAGDVRQPSSPLPAPSAELFIAAGVALAQSATRTGAAQPTIEEILKRAVDQAAALRGEVA